jgi:uncharacterized protein YggE
MPPQDQHSPPQLHKSTFRVPTSPWVATLILVLAIVVIIVIWKPWQPNIKSTDRTISVTGTATITTTPDQYVFSPSYDLTSPDKQTALSNLANKSSDIVNKLKALGVLNTDIKTNSSGYSNSYYLPVQNKGGSYIYTLDLTITINNARLAQKVQDYLLTTSPTGDISPSVDFSNAKKITVQNEARNLAEKDARSKADQSAANLGFKVDRVKSVIDGSLDTSYPRPMVYGGISAGSQQAATPQLSVQPGQNDLNYSVSVVYYIH